MRCILILACSLPLSGLVIAQTPAPSGVQLSLAANKSSRFATAAVYDDLLKIYLRDSGTWDGGARGALLAYLARYGGESTMSLLRQNRHSTGRSCFAVRVDPRRNPRLKLGVAKSRS